MREKNNINYKKYLLFVFFSILVLLSITWTNRISARCVKLSNLEPKTWSSTFSNSNQETDTDSFNSDVSKISNEADIVTTKNPNAKGHNFTVAICAVAKDAEAYLQEWFDYHLIAMGFDHIYLYDHSVDFELKRWYERTRNHSVYSHITIVHYKDTGKVTDEKGVYNQLAIYTDCVKKFGMQGQKIDFLAFIDVDEFFVLQDEGQYSGIHDVLEKYLVPYGGALVVNWSIMGTANKTVYAPLPVTKRFQYRTDYNLTGIVKSIVKASDFVDVRNPHAVVVGKNKHIHTLTYPGDLHKQAKGRTGASCADCSRNVMLLNHYRYTSMKEYIFKKCTRGNMDGASWCKEDKKTLRNDMHEHLKPQPGTFYDDRAWRFLKKHVPRYRMYDQWQDFT